MSREDFYVSGMIRIVGGSGFRAEIECAVVDKPT